MQTMPDSRRFSHAYCEDTPRSNRFRDFFSLRGHKKLFSRPNAVINRSVNQAAARVPASRSSQTDPEVSLHKIDVKASPRITDLPTSPAHLEVSKEAVNRTIRPPQFLLPLETHERDRARSTRCFDRSSTASIHRKSGRGACSLALSIPEIVEHVMAMLDEQWAQTRSLSDGKQNSRPTDSNATLLGLQDGGPLFSCLAVDRTFYWAARRVLSRRVELTQLETLEKYASSAAGTDNLCKDLLIHRVKTCDQSKFETIKQYRLCSLELYVCPKLIPTSKMLASGTLLKLALPGCGLVGDDIMAAVAETCHSLEILDLRACELVTDKGIGMIARNCPRLSYLNVGRVKNASGITDRSIISISANTSVETIGLAGCAVSDLAVLAIARYRGSCIERLSMNQCHAVSDVSICELLRSSTRLQVLEIVGCEKVNDARTLSEFKIKSGALIETSIELAAEMQGYENELRRCIDGLAQRSRQRTKRLVTI